MELLCLCCVKHIQALLAHKLIVNIRVFLVDIIGEGVLAIEVGTSTVWADELLVVRLCQVVNQPADTLDVCVVTPLFKLVVQDVHYLCTSVPSNVEWCNYALLIICCWCVHVEVDGWVLLFELPKVFSLLTPLASPGCS